MGIAGDTHGKVGRDRRQFTRIPARAIPEVTAQVVGGPKVRLIDLSRRGALVETSLALRPGRSVTIRFVAADTTLTLTGAVVRSSVAVLTADGVTYHTALSFAEDVVICPLTVDAAETTPGIDLMVVPTPSETGNGLRERLLANSW